MRELSPRGANGIAEPPHEKNLRRVDWVQTRLYDPVSVSRKRLVRRVPLLEGANAAAIVIDVVRSSPTTRELPEGKPLDAGRRPCEMQKIVKHIAWRRNGNDLTRRALLAHKHQGIAVRAPF